MSNPSANLKKGKRTPLPGVGKRPAPFRNSSSQSIADKVVDNALRSPSQQSSRSDSSVHRGRPPHLPKLGRHQQESASVPTDFDLMNDMMSKISKLELQIQYYAREILEKDPQTISKKVVNMIPNITLLLCRHGNQDKRISVLEEKARIKDRASSMSYNVSNDQKLQEMEKKCSRLQKHVKEMEDFLADYGMVFVGGTSSSSDETDGVYEDLSVDKQWRPESSVAASRGAFHVDYDRITKNVRELNVLGGEGEKTVQPTVKGAKLKTRESIPLTLYANGIFMFNGPFRPFQGQKTQQFVQDLMDGFFPSELQARYPEGVPMELNDQRETFFQDPRGGEHFPGVGQPVGGETTPSRLVPNNLDKTTNTDLGTEERLKGSSSKGLHYTSKPPGIQMTQDQFLSKLPTVVMRDGKVIDIRSSVADSLMDKETPTTVTIIKTPATRVLQDQDGGHQGTQSPTLPEASERVTTLRVKSASGERTFIVKMKYEETIRDLRAHLDKHRPFPAANYELMTTFPNRTYPDLDVTLEECGLTPNATVHIKKR